MKYGFVRVAAITPEIKVCDCKFNTESILSCIDKASKENVEIALFPELCISGYSCGDLFFQKTLLEASKSSLLEICEKSKNYKLLIVVGVCLENKGKLYSCGAVISKGEILGIVPKTNIPEYGALYEKRTFSEPPVETEEIIIGDMLVPFGTDLIFEAENLPEFRIAVELGEDLNAPIPPSSYHALNGASLILNLSASSEAVGKAKQREDAVRLQSAKALCGYAYASAGEGESTTDLVFSAHNIIAECGRVLNQSKRFENEMTIADIDLELINSSRMRNSSFSCSCDDYYFIPFVLDFSEDKPQRLFNAHPFIPSDKCELSRRCEDILNIQAYGLKKRLKHINCDKVVLGISGGLDSTLALIACVKAFDLSGLDRKNILAVTMPCFGTSERTRANAIKLCESLGVSLSEVNLTEPVSLHFENIGKNPEIVDVTFENAQARERTQVLMDIACMHNCFVVGTGDLSELALGWATYNGDHMSMYGINASIPKTLIRYIIEYFAKETNNNELSQILDDIIDTPVSPELIPPDENGNITQSTENIVGPYELHDFFLYNVLRFGFAPKKILFMAENAFNGKYDKDFILSCLKKFYSRFFTQQFKRSCSPDGVKVGSVALSPRGDLRMPSDAVVRIWLDELECQE